MPTIAGFIPQQPVSGYARTYLSIDLDSYGDDWLTSLADWVALPSPGAAGLATHWPVSAAPRAIGGQIGRSYADDFYHRVHLSPAQLDVGNMTSPQVHEVTVWNAHLSAQLLSTVAASGDWGLTLSQPEAAPTYFQPLEERTYALSISTDGPPVIDALFLLSFSSGTLSLTVVGKRVVLWPFIPQTDHRESLEWKTDVIPSFNNEQRIALRAAPRQSFSHSFQLDPRQFSRAKAIATQWSHRVYGVPVWAEATRLGAVSAGATAIVIDTSIADYRAADLVIIWESDEKYEAVETTTITSGVVNLKLPVVNSYTNAYVAPVRFARTREGVTFARGAHTTTTAKVGFLVTSNKDLGASTGWPTYRGKDVLTDRTVLVSDLSERITRTVTEFDNGSGPIAVDPANNWVRSTKTVTFDALTRGDKWLMRQWLHSRRGRQKAFWMPSWNADLEILNDIGVSSQSIVVKPIGYPLYYGLKDIMIMLKSGTPLFARVLSGATDVDGNEVLGLEAQLGVAVLVTDVDFVCFLSHVRFDSDRVDITHGAAGRATVSIPVVETPEV